MAEDMKTSAWAYSDDSGGSDVPGTTKELVFGKAPNGPSITTTAEERSLESVSTLPPRPDPIERRSSSTSSNPSSIMLKRPLPEDNEDTIRRGNVQNGPSSSNVFDLFSPPEEQKQQTVSTGVGTKSHNAHHRNVSWDVNVKGPIESPPPSPVSPRTAQSKESRIPTTQEVRSEQERHAQMLHEAFQRLTRQSPTSGPAPDQPILVNEGATSGKDGSPNAHQRFISWDKSFKASLGATREEEPFDVERSPSGDSTISSGSKKARRHQAKKLSLDHVLKQHPLEAEAETLVLAAIEDLDPTIGEDPQTSSLGSSILSNVPRGSEGVFSIANPDSVAGTAHSNAGEESASHSRASLVRRQQQQQQRQQQQKHHHRQQTMEQRLDGLTDALEAIHDETNEDEQPPLHEIMAANLDTGKSSSAAMDKHANVLFQRRKRTEDISGEAHLATVYAGGSGSENGSRQEGLEGEDLTSPQDGNDGDVESGSDNGMSRQSMYPTALLRKKKSDSRCDRLVNAIPFLREFLAFSTAYRKAIRNYALLLFWIILPALAISFILFYLAGNPPTGRIDLEASNRNGTLLINHFGKPVSPSKASASWWILFMCVRQMITLSVAQATQFFVIDFLCIGRQWTGYLNPVVTLLIVQSRGWPFLFIGWSINNFLTNYGDHVFASHWLFWQDRIGLFNIKNPSGGVPVHELNFRLLVIALCVGFVVALKRTWMGFFLGRKTYVNYAATLTKIMKKIILLSKVADLAKKIEQNYVLEGDEHGVFSSRTKSLMLSEQVAPFLESENGVNLSQDEDDAEENSSLGFSTGTTANYVIDPEEKNILTGSLTDAQHSKITKLLGVWEEPEKALGVEEKVSVSAILKFRQSLTFLDTPFTFSYAFGLVDTRAHCIESAQEVYMRLLLDTPNEDVLNFATLAALALRRDGTFHTDILKDLIYLLRPGRDGNLSLLDFVKSVDTVYKKARLLRASVKNSQKIDRAFEQILNIFFYVVLGSIVLSQLGFDPFALFLSLSSLIVAFAFMIGTASSKYFEGLLFILVQRPYDIGDRINIEQQNAPGNHDGSVSWIVKDVSLFTTTLVMFMTNECATVSNGSLASCRIINGARSPMGLLYVYLKFGIEVPYEKIQIFKEALTAFVKARPREWISLINFRSIDIQADQGFVEYVVVLQHRQSWQEFLTLKISLAQVQSFCLELSKKLDMRYKSPPLPVNLSLDSAASAAAMVPTLQPVQSARERSGSEPSLPSMSCARKMSSAEAADIQKVSAMFANA